MTGFSEALTLAADLDEHRPRAPAPHACAGPEGDNVPINSLAGDSDLEREFELETTEEDEEGAMTELEEPFEALEDLPREHDEREAGEPGDFVERFLELASHEYESESEVDAAVNGVLHDIEREYFFKGLTKRLGGLGKKFLAQGLRTVGQVAGKNFPAVQALTQLARGNLRGMLAPLAKSALTAAVPGLGAAMPVLGALGFEAGEEPALQREAWQNYVTLAREAYEDLASNLSPDAQDPLGANRLAGAAMRNALSRTPRGGGSRGGVRRIQVRRGERLVIEVV